MTGVEICLLVVGAAFIIVGNMFSERKRGRNDFSSSGREIWSDKDEIAIKDRVNIVLADKSEYIINETDDKLCHISNEKIMEFQEYADQLLEKLNENHNQTVFMYKMLTDKQDEMKEWITDIDKRYTSVKDEINSYSNNIPVVSENNNIKPEEKKEQKHTEKNSDMNEKKVDKKDADTNENVIDINKKEVKKSDFHKNNKSGENDSKVSNAKSVNISNKNEKILELYDAGKNIVEVSKALGIGQGEVKLVVGLYRGKK